MNLFVDYIRERQLGDVIVDEGMGFIWYQQLDKVCFVREAFVDKRFREAGILRDLEAQLQTTAREIGCNQIQCTVQLGTPGDTRNLQVVEALGYEQFTTIDNYVYFKKDLT